MKTGSYVAVIRYRSVAFGLEDNAAAGSKASDHEDASV